jgi:hypothetical protein
MRLLKLGEKEHDMYVVMFIGGHYLKCLTANAVCVFLCVFVCVVCVCVCVFLCASTEIISVSNLWDVLKSVVRVQMGKEIYTSSAFYSSIRWTQSIGLSRTLELVDHVQNMFHALFVLYKHLSYGSLNIINGRKFGHSKALSEIFG